MMAATAAVIYTVTTLVLVLFAQLQCYGGQQPYTEASGTRTGWFAFH